MLRSTITILGLLIATCATADTVTLSSGEDAQGRVELSGVVVDYTGRQITIRTNGGNERNFPTSRVLAVETRWPEGYEQGSAELAAGNYSRAAELLAAAARADQRPWVRRLAMEHLMECYAAAGDSATAGRLLVELAKSDPATPALERAPLAWHSGTRVAPAVVAEWTASDQPVARLLGASYSLAGSERTAALATLATLARSGDEQIATLAEMQQWRTEVVTAKQADVERWQQRLVELPEALQAGGWLVVGDAWRQLRQADAAALAYLHSSMLAEAEPQLAAAAMVRAAKTLEAAGHQDEAQQLATELVRDYPKTAAAAEAKDMLQSPE